MGTEYADNYHKYSMGDRVMGKPHVTQLTVGGEFNGATESRDQFVDHHVSPRIPPPKRTWTPSNLPFDGSTTQRTEFPAWPITVPPPKEIPKWITSAGKFTGLTTNKTDFKEFLLEPHKPKERAKYVNSGAKLEGKSSHSEDYQAWPVPNRPQRRKQHFYAYGDDRDFRSTTNCAYVNHSLPPPPTPIKKEEPASLPAAPAASVTHTTSKDAYQPWPIQRRQVKEKAEWKPDNSKFSTVSTYLDNYKPKTVVTSIRKAPVVDVVKSRFVGISTQKADYLPFTNVKKLDDFGPHAKYMVSKEDRDFQTTTRTALALEKKA